MYRLIGLITLMVGSIACTPQVSEEQHFVVVKDQGFELKGQPYYVVGTNFWYGPYLGMSGEMGDRARLLKELDDLKSFGVTNLRILAASEGAQHKNALQPSFQPDTSALNEALFVGLDFLLSEMAKREMKAVLFLNNFWEWSGGMNMYSEWYGEGKATNPSETGDWTTFMNHSAKFYQNKEAQNRFRFYIKTLITRKNTINGLYYYEDPTIMSWQLANEPRPGAGDYGHEQVNDWIQWIDETAAYIKQLAPNHLVSSGNEGTKGSLESMDYFIRAHQSKNIDYLTFHMWAKNWGWYQASDAEATFTRTLDSASKYLYDHLEVAKRLNKPLVMEEFGLARDQEVYDPKASTLYRDRYYTHVYAIIEKSIADGSPLVGSNFWAWGGDGKASSSDYAWKPGDNFTGDPPQEPQGLNSVFRSDSTTLQIIRKHAIKLKVIHE
jgi:mannan endo-1,4-beta-mannosidase